MRRFSKDRQEKVRIDAKIKGLQGEDCTKRPKTKKRFAVQRKEGGSPLAQPALLCGRKRKVWALRTGERDDA